MKQSFVDLCRENLIPFSKADALLYKLQGQKDTFNIFSVIFNQLVNNSKASPEAGDLIERIIQRSNETDKSPEELKEQLEKVISVGKGFAFASNDTPSSPTKFGMP